MKQTATIFGLFCAVLTGWAQPADTVDWTATAVTDASWPEPASPAIPFQFNGWMELENHSEKLGPTWHTHYVTRARWLKSESYMADSVAERCRPLAQLYFDCYELESRKLQETINLPQTFFLREELNVSVENARSMIASLRIATNDGRNAEQLAYWRHWMDSALMATPRLYPPNWEPGSLELGFDIGSGFMVPTGSFAHYFNPQAGFAIGAGFRVRRFVFDYRLLYTYPAPQLPFTVADFSFGDTNRLQLNQSTLAIGLQVYRRERWAVIPYAGMSTLRILNKDINDGSLFSKSRVSAGAEGGLMVEWRFHHFYQSNHMQFYWKLLFKGGYEVFDFLNVIDGGSLKLQVGIGFSSRSVVNSRFAE